MADQPIHVASGTFRVDRSRALEKLQAFQLANVYDFCLPWLRCAAVAGAATVDLSKAKGTLQLRFDGQAFTTAELGDPYACLLSDEAPGGLRGRYLAMGLLAALRLEPQRIDVRSGGSTRHCLRVKSLTEDHLETEPGASAQGTEIDVVFSGLGNFLSADRALSRARESCALFPCPVLIEGKRADAATQDAFPTVPLNGNGRRGFLAVSQEPTATTSTLFFYKHGVRTAAQELEESSAFEAHINDDDFTLDAGQENVVRNDRFREVLALVEAQGERLIRAALAAHKDRVERELCAVVADPSLAPQLSKAFSITRWGGAWLIEAAMARSPIGDGTVGRILRWEMRVGEWLRSAALHSAEKKRRLPLDKSTKKVLWEAPLYSAVEGRPLSLAELEAQSRKEGFIPFSSVCLGAGGKMPLKVPWTPYPGEPTRLEAILGSPMRDMTDIVKSFAKLARS